MIPLEKLRAYMKTEALDAFIITDSQNRRYFSGFTGSAGILLITSEAQIILTDSRYYEQISREIPDWRLVKAGYQTVEYLQKILAELGLLSGARIGFEADHLTAAEFKTWREKLIGGNLVETSEVGLNLRAVKTSPELETMKRAIKLTDQAMTMIYDWIRPGLTEQEIAWELEVYLRTHGAQAIAFEIIVAAGANGALPHVHPSAYKLHVGDIVVIDMGCVIDGYASDLTRTFRLGEPGPADYEPVWNLVSQANQAAQIGLKAGMTGKAVDALAREVIEAGGYGDYFGHSLGHGVGLAIHEYPRLSYAYENVLPVGAVVTIEPGIYLPDQFGVRLEDMVLIGEDGGEVLTQAPKRSVIEV